MAKTAHYYEKFEPHCHYHVYNRAIDKKSLFTSPGNYLYFLKQYDRYLSPLVTTLSYGLMGNHFHFGIRINSYEALTTFAKLSKLDYPTAHGLVAHQFQRFFQSYAMAFNKQQGRVGTLFQTPFKRCSVDPDHLQRLILYHHLNARHHKLVQDFKTYPWTSYPGYLSERPSKLPRKEVFEIFGGKEAFIRMHDSTQNEMSNEDWMIEF